MNKEDVLFRLKKEVSTRTNLPLSEIDLVTPFSEFGLDSTDAVGITGELSEWLGIELDATLLWEFTNIKSLVDFLVVHQEGPIKEDVHDNLSDKSPINEPIAIIGMGSRFAGTNGLNEFWQLLCNGEDSITSPNNDKDCESKDVNRALYGGYINNIDKFDSNFFGISPREAERMDPQQRILLETTLEAMEHAGITEEMINGSKTGVFVGISNNDYGRDLLQDNENTDIYSITGNAFSIAANRISYLFNLKGPSLAVDTACSSSLAVVHQACQSLRLGECNMAIAGGVNLALTPEITQAFDEAGMLSKDRLCKTFDEKADGYVRGEGAGIVILKPLSKAISNRDNIISIIKGSAINHNGRSNGITAPNKSSQIQVLKEAYDHAGISPEEIQYIETHGTGTSLGDPIEVDAIGRTLNKGNADFDCRIGSVKTNIGHLEASAGIAGLIKTCLSIKHRKLPPSLNVNKPNPLIKFDRQPIHIQTELTPWPDEEKLLIAGVSSFGFGGTNVHMVVSEPPTFNTNINIGSTKDDHSTNIFPISAKSKLSLSLLVEKIRGELNHSLKNESWSNMCYTAQKRRSHYRYRHAITANSKNELKQELDDILMQPFTHKNDLPNVTFVFTGQGAEWFRMGKQLYNQNQTFRETVQQCDQIFFQYAGWSIIEELLANEKDSRLIYTEVVQPLIFTIQVSLARLWISLGITPSSTIGHSVGEICAYHIAGAINLEEALFLVYHRGQSMKSTLNDGKMLAIRASIDVAEQLVSEHDGITLAAHNGPNSIVLSGDAEIIKTIKEKCNDFNIKAKIINHHYAFHSNKMDSIMNDFSKSIKSLTFKETGIPVFSTTTGKKVDGEVLTTHYWVKNVRDTVRFSEAIQNSCQYGMNTFIEIGPHQILASDIIENTENESMKVLTLPSMKKNQDEIFTFSQSLSVLYELGLTPKWDVLFNHREGALTTLPTYAWDRQTYWKTEKGLNEFRQNNSLQPEIVYRDDRDTLLPKKVLEADDEGRKKIIIEYMREQIAKVLKMKDSKVDLYQPLNTIGLDSIMAIELKNKVETDLNIDRISIVKFLDGQTLLDVTEELINMVIDKVDKSDEMPEFENHEEESERIEQILDNLDHIDNDQIDRLLNKYMPQ